MHPLDFHLLPPNAYPLQNSIPFILVFTSRIWLWKQREKQSKLWWPSALTAYSIFVSGVLFNEYATVLGVTLLLLENLSLTTQRYSQRGSLLAATFEIFATRRFWLDALVLLFALGVYVIFRAMNPSEYAGNSLDGLFRLNETWTTLYLHIFSSTTFTRLDGSTLSVFSAPSNILLLTAFVGGLTYIFFVAADKPRFGSSAVLVTVVACIFTAVFFTLPIAGIVKYQDWCLEGGICTYLDSRMSLYPVGVLVVALCLGALSRVGGRVMQLIATAGISLALALVSSFTFFTNWEMEQKMKTVVSAWDRASAVACDSKFASADNRTLAQLIEPVRRLPIINEEMKAGFWQVHLENRRRQLDCDNLPASIAKWSNQVKPEQYLSFENFENYLILASGWNGPEPWGVWSRGNITEINIYPTSPGIRALGFKFHLFPPPQAGAFQQLVEVSVNGEHLSDWSYPLNECNARVIELPDPLPANKETRIVFSIAKPTSPKSIGYNEDTRELGLGMLGMKLAGADDPKLRNWLAKQCQ